jgi:hypothetical protein
MPHAARAYGVTAKPAENPRRLETDLLLNAAARGFAFK